MFFNTHTYNKKKPWCLCLMFTFLFTDKTKYILTFYLKIFVFVIELLYSNGLRLQKTFYFQGCMNNIFITGINVKDYFFRINEILKIISALYFKRDRIKTSDIVFYDILQ